MVTRKNAIKLQVYVIIMKLCINVCATCQILLLSLVCQISSLPLVTDDHSSKQKEDLFIFPKSSQDEHDFVHITFLPTCIHLYFGVLIAAHTAPMQ